MRLYGAVLAGGRSARMGTAKAMVDVGGRPMAAAVIDALRRGGCDPVVIVGGDPGELSPLGVPVVDDLFPGEGPVGGVLTALDWASGTAEPDDWVLVTSCDLPGLDDVTVRSLAAAAREAPAVTGAVVAGADRVEPALAMWRIGAVATLRACFDAGDRALHAVLAAVPSATVPVPAGVVRNVNTPDDLARFRESISSSDVTIRAYDPVADG